MASIASRATLAVGWSRRAAGGPVRFTANARGSCGCRLLGLVAAPTTVGRENHSSGFMREQTHVRDFVSRCKPGATSQQRGAGIQRMEAPSSPTQHLQPVTHSTCAGSSGRIRHHTALIGIELCFN
ncbi:hypothetical protein P7K49_009237 [Saguinus oedipus]|uniref:Uncharacterized protein n=1 Tax=Saguinus oedipus TaxID=9490 RepID=A0ABQ9VK08_SAGOE|nr:hypothetical protein P7K49_009237 [Saguinus oedipus]